MILVPSKRRMRLIYLEAARNDYRRSHAAEDDDTAMTSASGFADRAITNGDATLFGRTNSLHHLMTSGDRRPGAAMARRASDAPPRFADFPLPTIGPGN